MLVMQKAETIIKFIELRSTTIALKLQKLPILE